MCNIIEEKYESTHNWVALIIRDMMQYHALSKYFEMINNIMLI